MSAATQNEMERLRKERDKAINERDYLVEQYEKAVGCEPQGFIHAACHIYNAIVNAKCDVNAERFTQLMSERDLARRDLINQAVGADLVRDRLREKANNARSQARQQDSAFYHRCANVAANKASDLRQQAETQDD